MTDRRAFKVSLCIGLLLFVAGVRGQRVPCDAESSLMAKAAAQEVPTLAGEHSIRTAHKLELPDIEAPKEAVPVGRWFVIGMPTDWKAPDGVRVKLTWVFAGYEALPYGPNRYVPFIVKAGEYTVVREATWATTDDQGRSDKAFKFTVGDPPPDRSLSELAGDKIKPLAEWYAKVLAAIPSYPGDATAGDWYKVHAGEMAAVSLTGSPYEAAALKLLDVGPGDMMLDRAKLTTAVTDVLTKLGQKPVDPNKPPVDPNVPTATAATYVYEKDQGEAPAAVMSGINRLNRERHIRATLFEEDVKDGTGDTPDQYKVALAAAVKAGLPAFVVTAGDTVLVVVKSPTTEAQVFEAVK